MLTAKDYLEYVKQLGRVEEEMRDTYRMCAEKTDDKSIKDVLMELAGYEDAHILMVKGLEKFFDGTL
jgi:rubrerythrin